jgi:hypothetical protein
MTKWNKGASGNNEGKIFKRTSQARPFNARCRISGTGPAPIQMESRPGYKSGITKRSGTSTSEKRMFLSGNFPGGHMV